MAKITMEDLRELSKMYLKTAERTDAKVWEKETTQDPVVPHKSKVTFSEEVTVIPSNPTPKKSNKGGSKFGSHHSGRQQWVTSQKYKGKIYSGCSSIGGYSKQ